MPFQVPLLKPISVVVLGCAITVEGEMHFSFIGFAMVLLCVILRCFKSVLQQRFMTSDATQDFDPVALTAWSCCFASGIVATYSVMREGSEPVRVLVNSTNIIDLSLAICVACCIASALNISGLFLTKSLGAVGSDMVVQVKAIVVVV